MKRGTSSRRFVYAVAAVLTVGGLFLAQAPAFGQYFGRNKVQYEKFEYLVLKTEHFDVYFYPEMREAAQVAARMAERWYKRFSRIFSHELKGRQPLIIYGSHPHFEQTTAISGILGEGTGGVTESFKRRIVLPFGGTLAETDHVIGHELIHAFQFDVTSNAAPNFATAEPTALRLPLWFIEGMAEYLSIGPIDAHTAMWMRDAVRRKKMPTVKQLESSRYFPYRYGQALWAYIAGRWGDLIVPRLLREAGRSPDYGKTLERALGITLKQLSTDWHKSLELDCLPLASSTKNPADFGPLVVKGSEEVGLNVSPVISPDGKQFVFLSSKDLFSIEMFVADAKTGKTEKKLTRTAVDPHIQSLQFINSAGSWNRDGDRFVFGAVSKGQPILALIDVKGRKIEQDIPFAQLGEILNPTFAPDGKSIAFSALTGGQTDLYIYDLDQKSLRQLTDDLFSDIHPAWSPDGRSIAFVTDRFSTHMPSLSPGFYQLALIDPASAEIKPLETFRFAKNINPQWSADSRSLYFLSDQSGITNVYRYVLESGGLTQVTNLYTGVSGITSLSPALSVAGEASKLVYSAYDEGNYSIFSIEDPGLLAGQAVQAPSGKTSPAALSPAERKPSEILGLLKNPLFGLPDRTDYSVSAYKPKLTLEYVAPPQVAVGVDRYGSYVGGGLALFFGDMMGEHSLVTMAQTSNRLIDTAALVGYQNSAHRWNWGAAVQRMPYVYGYYGMSIGDVFGEPAIIEQEFLFRQINYELAGYFYYPFSQVLRFEASSGVSLIDFQAEEWTRAYSLYDGMLLLDMREDRPSPKSMTYGFLSAALVHDSSIFGATAPVLGQSYRFEVMPTLGSVNFFTVLADYRRYIVPVKPFTLAFRALTYGRYGKGSDDERLWDLFIGYESMVRGYDYGSFDSRSNFDYNRLFGSRIAIGNVELRVPVFGVLGLGKGYYGIWPLEFLAFYDIGVAWNKSTKPTFLGGERKPISSAGIGLRTNILGYFILGLDLVHPFDRADKNWVWQFTIYPGF